MWWRRLAEVQTEHQNGEERGFKWLWNVDWLLVPDGLVWVFQKLLIYWDALTIYCPQETLTQNYRCYTARCKPLTSTKNRKAKIRVSKKAQRWDRRVLELCLWTDETKMNLYLSDGKAKMWRKKGTANNPKHTASSVKRGGGVVMAWACMAVSGTGRLNFTDDLMYDDSSRMNLEGYKTILPTNIQENANRFIGKCFILHQNNDPKHPASSVKEFIRAKKWKVLDCPSLSPDLIPIEHEFQHLKRRVKTETPQNKQQLELAALKAGKSISKDENKSLVMSMCHRLTAVIVRKGSATK